MFRKKTASSKCIVVFGAGEYGRTFARFSTHIKKNQNVIFIDNNPALQGRLFDKIPVYSPKELHLINISKIYIYSRHIQDMLNQLKSLNIPNTKIKIITEANINFSTNFLINKRRWLKEKVIAVSKEFKKLKVKHWLDHSGLLAVIRDKDLAFQTDIDFSVCSDEIESIASHFNNYFNDIIFKKKYAEENGPYWKKGDLLTFSMQDKKTFVSIDIMTKYFTDKNVFWLVNRKILKCPLSFFSGHNSYDIHNHKFRVPLKVKKYLTYLYGDWEQPVDNWSDDDFCNIWKNLDTNYDTTIHNI